MRKVKLNNTSTPVEGVLGTTITYKTYRISCEDCSMTELSQHCEACINYERQQRFKGQVS